MYFLRSISNSKRGIFSKENIFSPNIILFSQNMYLAPKAV